jgi:hypothetical protein
MHALQASNLQHVGGSRTYGLPVTAVHTCGDEGQEPGLNYHAYTRWIYFPNRLNSISKPFPARSQLQHSW